MTIIAKFSDYRIQPIEYFITALTTSFAARNIKSLTNGKVEVINISKQHPLAILMQALVQGDDVTILRSSLIPAISIIPGDQNEGGFTFNQSFHSEIIDDNFIEDLEIYLTKTNKQILESAALTKDQVNTIVDAYEEAEENSLICDIHEWRKSEIINISIWSDTPDIDNLFSILLDSILADMQVGQLGDNSLIQNMSYRAARGLTNFNFGRILFGSEYILTYTNTYKNYTIISDPRITEHEFHGTFETL